MISPLRSRFAVAIVAIVLALPGAAWAQQGEETIVPPDNGAVNQYTEAIPTARGGKDPRKGGGRTASPAEVLGARNARNLEEQGADGEAVAELTAETAPAPSGAATGDASMDAPPAGTPSQAKSPGTGKGKPNTQTRSAAAPPGDSGVGEVVGHATGSSSDELGLLLPLLILGAAGWAVLFALRQRRRQTS